MFTYRPVDDLFDSACQLDSLSFSDARYEKNVPRRLAVRDGNVLERRLRDVSAAVAPFGARFRWTLPAQRNRAGVAIEVEWCKETLELCGSAMGVEVTRCVFAGGHG